MTLGEQLRKQVDHRRNKEVALTWLERWKAVDPGFDRRPDSVVQQFSRCLNDNLSGVRFFFKQRERAEVLFDVLDVAQDQREALWEGAQQLLGESAPSPRVVVDLTPWSERQQETVVFNHLRRMLDEVPVLRPVTLVLTAGQAERVPNGLASLSGVSLEQVSSSADGWEKTLDLATETTLVMSQQRLDSLDHWMALEVADGKLQVHPDGGLKTFAEDGVLRAPLAVTHLLSALVGAVNDNAVKEPESAVQVRRLIFELADEDSALCRERKAEYRAALASLLRVDATSTSRERLEHELGGLARELCEVLNVKETSVGAAGEVDKELALRKLRTMPPKVIRVDDQLHVLVEPGQVGEALPKSGRLTVHESAPKVVLREFVAELSQWGDEDYLRDPYYDRLLQRLDPPEGMKLIYHHARAFLLATGHHPPPQTGEPTDWRAGLDAVLADGPPAAELLLPVEQADKQLFERPMGWLDVDDGSRVLIDDDAGAWWRYLPPATSQIAVGRNFKVRLQEGSYGFLEFKEHNSWGSKPVQEAIGERRGLMSLKMLDNDPVATWQGLLDASGFLSDYCDQRILDHERRTRERDSYGRQLLTASSLGIFASLGRDGSGRKDVPIVSGTWTRADDHIGALWLALRVALRDPLFTTFHDGSVLLALGGSVLSRIRVQTSPCHHPGPPRVFLVGPVQKHKYEERRWIETPEHSLYTHEAVTGDYTTRLGLTLPVHVLVYAGGFRVSMMFAASALLGPGVNGPTLGAIAGSITEQLRSEQAERDAWDDDD
jgi:hypothetical protein